MAFGSFTTIQSSIKALQLLTIRIRTLFSLSIPALSVAAIVYSLLFWHLSSRFEDVSMEHGSSDFGYRTSTVLLKGLVQQARGNSLKGPASTAYAQVFAPHHGWAIKKAVAAGMYALPTKAQLLKKLNEDGNV